jgi:hypothetical protein
MDTIELELNVEMNAHTAHIFIDAGQEINTMMRSGVYPSWENFRHSERFSVVRKKLSSVDFIQYAAYWQQIEAQIVRPNMPVEEIVRSKCILEVK